MSMFNWFTRKPSAISAVTPETLPFTEATVSHTPVDKLQTKFAPPPVSHSSNRKNERLEHRELLYKVVHDSMIRAGVLAASYKFKVLSLDARGLQYMIMMDLVNQSAGDTRRLAEIEAMMAQAAKARHDILITAVYWRVSELVTTGLSPNQAPSRPDSASKLQDVRTLHPATTTAPYVSKSSAYEPLQQDEVDAFKQALASAANTAPYAEPGRLVTSGRRNPAPPEEFEDTQIAPSNDRISPLSVTQYGDLN